MYNVGGNLAENINDLVSVVNMDLEFEYINETTHKNLIGYSNVELLGKKVSDFIHTDDRENFLSLFNNSIDFMQRSYQNRNLNIELNTTNDSFHVQANQLLREVFDNILINSVKYNSYSNPSVDIFITISREIIDEIKFIKMQFIDNGIGVPDDRKNLIFQRGNRELKGSKGMGIGLSLVKRILKNYKGKIWVENRIEDDYSKGSNFNLLIPEAI
ncbi:hypothetical protein LCGC14_0587310 [marine sediment metagenome]|uniref:histidine kinase n=1 Tax=marine sediment metagenome TaxID=412755 RepID=A0A0F9REN2_9ZZZZ|nr:PAS domain S-box protein [bacterium]